MLPTFLQTLGNFVNLAATNIFGSSSSHVASENEGLPIVKAVEGTKADESKENYAGDGFIGIRFEAVAAAKKKQPGGGAGRVSSLILESSQKGRSKKADTVQVSLKIPKAKSAQIGISSSRKRLRDSSVSIRPMELKDCAACFHLGEKVFSIESYPTMYRTFDEFEIIEAFSGDPELCFVAEIDQKIVGFILGSEIHKQKTRTRMQRHYGYLSWVVVAPEYQRQGIGTALYERLIQSGLPEVDQMLADTSSSNVAGKLFLGSLGYSAPIKHVYLSKQVTFREKVHTGAALQLEEHVHGSIKYRPLKLDDIFPAFQLGNQVYTQANLYTMWDEYEIMDLYQADTDFCIAAVDATQKLVGFALGTTIEKHSKSTYGYLRWLAVSHEYQRFGVGRHLYECFEELVVAAGAKVVIIDTQADNTPAIKFFKRMGFGNAEDHLYYRTPVKSIHKKTKI